MRTWVKFIQKPHITPKEIIVPFPRKLENKGKKSEEDHPS
jgi:hypothetical protein